MVNLVCLCRGHHGVVHRTGWSVHLDADGWAIFTSPNGQRFWGQRHGRQREGPPPDPADRPEPHPDRPGSFIAPGRYHRIDDPLVHAEARQLILARIAELPRPTAA